ncbi:hypothetical protein DFR74_10882 [Nocardia puris]|uniref:Hsp70 protein n=1 Tax=Nocardia puris TaxID=208602 RepID=A0A366DFK8_9NOCA|nr:hypothetical protein DFR74_10882 [Nocardia puris]
MHLGWDVVSVAAGGGSTPIRPVQVEGTFTPPAYLLADASGRLHTAGVDRQRPDLGMAIADVRDIIGHSQIVVAGATWPAEMVFRARMYNPLASIGKYLRGKPDVVALPFPDGWPDEKVDAYAELVETLDVTVEPLPESVALSGYVRALGLVRPPDGRMPHGIGATGVYSDGRTMLVVAVHGDDEQPTESVDVPVGPDAMRDARSADNVVIEVMAAARAIGADTSTVLLTGNVCFNDALRLAFQNHLGHRLHVADHPMHALVLGATHLLVTDSDAGEPQSSGRHAEPPRQDYPPQPPRPAPPVDPGRRGPDAGPPSGSPVVSYGPGYPTVGPGAPDSGDEPTRRVTREDLRGLPPNAPDEGGRFTRPPEDPGSPRGRHASVWDEPEEHDGGKGKVWNKVRDNLFGAQTVVGAVALAIVALPGEGGQVELTASAAESVAAPVACGFTPRAILGEPRQGITTVRGFADADAECAPNMDTLRYVVPGPPGAVDPGPPVQI